MKEKSEKKILLIGGLGYIGSMLFDVLKAQNYFVNILDSHLYKCLPPNNPYIECDIRNKNLLQNYIANYEIIINLASLVGEAACLFNKELTIDINCTGVKNVVDICKENNVKLIHISTCSVYGDRSDKLLDENDRVNPIDFYAQTKFTQESYIKEQYGNESCILRLGTVYGISPRMRYDLIVNLFAAKSYIEKEIRVYGGHQHRPFVHIIDVCRAIEHAIKSDLSGLYNILNQNLSILELSNIFKDKTNCNVIIEDSAVDKRNYRVDNSKILKTGFEFKYSIENGIEELFKSPTIHNYQDKKYSNHELLKFS